MRPGDVVDGKYELVRLVGQGGMGSVYEARHLRLGLKVALKFLRQDLAESPEASQRFLREAQAAAAIGSDHIVRVTDVGDTRATGPYIVMEFLEGEDLAHLLAREGPLGLGRAVRLVSQVCRGLGAAHDRGIVHRDLKPENLVLTRREDGAEWVKVLDFGIAKVRDTVALALPQLTATGNTMGTPYYMSPEQAWGAKDIDSRADQYSAAVLLYELLTGQRPFKAGSYNELIIRVATQEPEPPRAHRPDLPAELEAVMLRALSREREDRFPSMAAFADALSPWSGAPDDAPPSSPTRPGAPPAPEGAPGKAPGLALETAETVAGEASSAGPADATPVGDIGTDPTLLPGPASSAAPAPGASVARHPSEMPRMPPGAALPTPTPPGVVTTAPPRRRRSALPWILGGAGLVATCVVGAPFCVCARIVGSVGQAVSSDVPVSVSRVGPADGGPGAVEVTTRHGKVTVTKAMGADGRPTEQVRIAGPGGKSILLTEEPGQPPGTPLPHLPPPVLAPAPPPPVPGIEAAAPAAGAEGPAPTEARTVAAPTGVPAPTGEPSPSGPGGGHPLSEARAAAARGDYQACVARLRGGEGGPVGRRLLFDCLWAAGRRVEACGLARRQGLFLGRERLARCR